MAYTNKTTHYELPQYVGNDKPTYLGDFNGAMEKIDTAIFGVDTKAESAISNADSASETANNAYEVANGAKSTANGAQSTANTAQQTATDAQSTATSALNVANNVGNRLNSLESNVGELVNTINGLKGTVLWTNPNPTTSFDEQDITLASDNYDYLIAEFEMDLTAPQSKIEYGLKNNGLECIYNSDTSLRWWARRFNFINLTTFHVKNCVLISYADPTQATVANDKCIPIRVIGIKNSVF